MKATLYKLKEGYVLCSDEEIKENDLHINLLTLEIENASKNLSINILSQNSFGDSVRKQYKKVLTQSPILSSLSPDKQKEIGWFDVNKYVSFLDTPESLDQYSYDMGVVHGFQKALELTADRRFTEDDMISFSKQCFYKGFNKCKNDDANSFTSWREEGGILIKNIQQPKSWEVEVEEVNGVYKVIKLINAKLIKQ